MTPTVCVLAAGRGTRMGFADGALHKALVPLGNRAVLSHVLGTFPPSSRFVIAVGHLREQIEAYVSLAHPDLDVTFVEVENYAGPGSGPGLSLLACSEHLQEPFVLTASDSLIASLPPLGDRSWMGVAPVDDPLSYLTLELDPERRVVGFQERTGPSREAFVGVAYITQPDVYFDGVRHAAAEGELQVTPGFAALAETGIDGVEVDWTDVGTTETYAAARARFEEEPHGNRVAMDVTYLLEDRVVKWFREPSGADRRIERHRDLGDAVPALIASPSGWLAYEKVPGDTLRDAFDGDGVRKFLSWASSTVWSPRGDSTAFRDAVRRFYGDKTLTRLRMYLDARGGAEPLPGLVLNGLPTPTVEEALERELDDLVRAAVPTGFHGDLHEGNVIAGPEGFRLIDWRDDFGGLRDRGDQLYDLAKLVHTLELPESVMFAGTFRDEPDGTNGLIVTHEDTAQRAAARAAFWTAAAHLGVDVRALGVLDALVFINMAPLYDTRLGDHLYYLGRWLLEVEARSTTADEREAAFTAALR